MKSVLFLGLVVILSSFQVSQASTVEIIQPLVDEVACELDSVEFISLEAYHLELEARVIKLARQRGITLQSEEKVAAGGVVRIIVRVMRPGTAHAGTHDGQGHCNSGCGRGNH